MKKKQKNRSIVQIAILSLAMMLGMLAGILPGTSPAQLSSTPRDETWVTNGGVFAIARYGNTIYIGGEFTEVGTNSGGSTQTRNGIAALDATTGIATSWDPNALDFSGSGSISDIVVSSDGATVYVGGVFWNIGGQMRNNIAAIDATTGNANSWNPNANGLVDNLALSSDGSTLYVGGNFTSIGGQSRNNIAALEVSTGNATSWNPNAPGGGTYVFDIAVSDDDSTVYAGGNFTSIGGQSRNRIAALDATTGNATTWDPDSDDWVYVLELSGSTLYVGGLFSNIGGQTRNYIAAIDTSTGNATSWDPNANNQINTLEVSGTTVYTGGAFTFIGGQVRNRIAAIDMTTGNATPWNPDANGIVFALLSYGSGTRLYSGGWFTTIGGEVRSFFAEFRDTSSVMDWEIY